MASHPFIYVMPLLFLCTHILSTISRASVPSSETFTYVNSGELSETLVYIVEYDATYRDLPPYRNPFQLGFYNTTPDEYTLALRMGTVRSGSLRRWVWEANRGNPVHENATLTLRKDGNLVLADADGRVAWQTNTANKGVVRFQLLPTGNMVLQDAKGNFVWQSFDSTTDTLLVGQTLRANGPNKLVSRLSDLSNVDGPYSLVMEPKGLAMYYKSPNAPRPMKYWSSIERFTIDKGSMTNLTLNSEPDPDDGYLHYLSFDYFTTNPSSNQSSYIAYRKFDSRLSFLRLEIDGNLRLYTYDDNLDGGWVAWELVYTFLDRDSREGECQLPKRCGEFGLCEDNQCVACPTANGLSGWSKNCEVKKVTSCKASDFHYYMLQGVDHFMIKYTKGEGPMKQRDCVAKCTKDCKCMGYFYHTDEMRCWIAYDLKTLTRVGNLTHLAYIKTPNK
ncbi:hypothetical protein M8C21_014964 [Ambrosia artemisiifolia]|uniref:Bulb-type lectin domain-containing protein n=1 Tax=Ambrosia artemisiifolia TaxID=4212 RepID=A0AAD5GLA0_AMBAR|nr:hypothetical protein M8C21_014964 [Ambrosia artemisiifolia]